DDEIYIIDDIEKNNVYMWVGLNSSDKKKDHATEFAREIESEQSDEIKILTMKQDREYGSFLAMMKDLKNGLIPGKNVDRRPELKLNIKNKIFEKDPDLRLSEEHQQHDEDLEAVEIHNLEAQIQEAAYFIYLKNYTYDELCWFLAEKIEMATLGMPSLEDIRKKAEKLFQSSITYDELCWLNGEIDVLTSIGLIEKRKIRFK
ncbi:MAG: hypothetical protein EU533_05745, partial [Promethearchaeota archaeon]